MNEMLFVSTIVYKFFLFFELFNYSIEIIIIIFLIVQLIHLLDLNLSIFFNYNWQVSSKVQSSIPRINIIYQKCTQFDKTKYLEYIFNKILQFSPFYKLQEGVYLSPNSKKFTKIFDKLENPFEKDSILNRPSTVNYQNFNFIRQQVSTYILNRRFPIHLKRLTLTKPLAINNYSKRNFSNFKLVKDGYEKYYKQILEKCEKRTSDEKSGKKIPFKLVKKSPKRKSSKNNQEEEKIVSDNVLKKCSAEESLNSCEQAQLINEKCIRMIEKSRHKKADKCKDARKECQKILMEHDAQKMSKEKDEKLLMKDECQKTTTRQEDQVEFSRCDRNQEVHSKKKNPSSSSTSSSSNPTKTSTDDSATGGQKTFQTISNNSTASNSMTNEMSKVKSKMEFLVSCIKKHSSDSLKSYLFKRSDKNESKIPRNPSSHNKPNKYLPKMNASYEDIKPDPPPPPSAHWSEKMKKKSSYNKYKPTIKPTTIEYIPYEEYKKKTKTLKRKSDEVKRMPKIIHIDEDSCRSPMCKKRAISLKERNKKPNSRYQFSTIDKSVDSKIDVYKKPNRKSNKNQSACESRLQQQGDTKSTDGHLIRRKRNENYKSNGEWKSQKYKVRLKIYKTKNSLDPCLPVMVEVRRHFCDEGVDFKGESVPFLNFKA